MNYGSESLGTEPKMESEKKSVSENAAEKSESFVIEMEAFSSANINKDRNSNSRITVQRSVSRKGWSGKKVNVPAASSPPTKGCCVAGPPEKVVAPAVGSPRVHHQITVTTGTMMGQARSIARRRPSNNSGLDADKIFIFCATLSCMGTILVIYLTLTMKAWR